MTLPFATIERPRGKEINIPSGDFAKVDKAPRLQNASRCPHGFFAPRTRIDPIRYHCSELQIRNEEKGMQRMTGGQAVIAALKAEGVEHIFGISGTHNTPLFDGAYGEPAIHVVTVRHEQGAAMMATGYARASGKIAACFVVPGPGLTNALTGMGMAYSESTPLLMFAGQNALAQLGREGDHFHELPNSLGVAGSLSGYAQRVSTPDAIPRAVREAMRAMRCRR
jgi:Thiamine pyrophosphate enzyme, N-terminal TPP binding domain